MTKFWATDVPGALIEAVKRAQWQIIQPLVNCCQSRWLGVASSQGVNF